MRETLGYTMEMLVYSLAVILVNLSFVDGTMGSLMYANYGNCLTDYTLDLQVNNVAATRDLLG